MTNAIPVPSSTRPRNCSKTSSPPAEAPIPTMGKATFVDEAGDSKEAILAGFLCWRGGEAFIAMSIVVIILNCTDNLNAKCIGAGEDLYLGTISRHCAVMATPTLAATLGTTTHLSPLLRKAQRLGLDAEGLERLAIQRGCDYYDKGEPLPPILVSAEQLSDAELAIALLNPALRYAPQTLRLGAAMLSAEANTPEEIAWRASMERCQGIVRYVAEAGQTFEPRNPFWIRLLQLLPPAAPPKSSVVPHPTRFVAMTGVTRRGVETVVEWIRPAARQPARG